ncbi:2-amino-4-hydroxy-6-hydroxymethyldihydropteridine diphosphokinase [Akkermansiaceae bacterium]|nr:2-amino-4-hydroxy-6-hydroxymethyldihydropteridine diphosphokinase [Akkermansiaceae bacterium]
MPLVAIALGSNLGDREANIAAAISSLRSLACPERPFLVASIHDTEPDGCPAGSPRFLNTAVAFDYSGGDPLELLARTQAIERELGREPSPVRNAPRVIDIDILTFGGMTLDHPALTLPHPRIAERTFVHLPLREIVPDS